MTDLKKWLIGHEDNKLFPYTDIVAKLSIGVGRNLTDNGISNAESMFMLDNDIARVKSELAPFDWYRKQPDGVRMALENMCFNLGISRLLGFRNMIAALIRKDYANAAKEALNSKWASQVHQRAVDVATMIRDGK